MAGIQQDIGSLFTQFLQKHNITLKQTALVIEF
jgi:hypothetical protein